MLLFWYVYFLVAGIISVEWSDTNHKRLLALGCSPKTAVVRSVVAFFINVIIFPVSLGCWAYFKLTGRTVFKCRGTMCPVQQIDQSDKP
ncbi:MAG: hypothetical protein JSS66_07335 [Armatimonadetes bacterium]|nr:hypothetical protein [Armatimonadota bacterium]